MAEFDTSIYGRLQPIKFADPLESQGRLMRLMAMRDQMEMSGLQRQKFERELQKEGRLSQLAQQSSGDPASLSKLLRSQGLWNEANQIDEQIRKGRVDEATINEKNAQAAEREATTGKIRAERMRNMVAQVSDDDAGYQMFRQAMLAEFPKDAARLPSNAQPGWRTASLRTADDEIKRIMPKAEFVNQGSQISPMNPYTAQPMGAPIPVGTSPDAQLQAGTAARGQDITQRGQDIVAETARAGQQKPAWDAERGVWVSPPLGGAPGGFIAPQGPTGQPSALPPKKDVPANINTAIVENSTAIEKVSKALDYLKKRPQSFGAQNILGDQAMQYLDQGGVEARAIVADLGSLKIHDRSGAAVTAAEFPRLRPFIPSATDRPETIRKKLENFKSEYESIQRDLRETYSPQRGFRANPVLERKFSPGDKFGTLDSAKQSAVARAYEDPANHEQLRAAGLIR